MSNHKALSSILRPMETPKDKLLTRARGSMLNVGSEKESERQSNGVSSDSIRQSNNSIKTQWKQERNDKNSGAYTPLFCKVSIVSSVNISKTSDEIN